MSRAEAGFVAPEIPEAQRSPLLIAHGPTIQVIVGHIDAKSATPTRATDGVSESVLALVDTGATESCIDDALAQKLGLPVIDRQKCAGAGGTTEHNVYLAWIDIPQLVHAQYGRFMGVHLESGGQMHRVLIGRTYLQGIVMVYDGPRGLVALLR